MGSRWQNDGFPRHANETLREMDQATIERVFNELVDRFGFPEKKWKLQWSKYLDAQTRGQNEMGIFLKFGYEKINPILNNLLLRQPSHPTFDSLCEFVIKNSESYRRKHSEIKKKYQPYRDSR
jgi:hypothetical protein